MKLETQNDISAEDLDAMKVVTKVREKQCEEIYSWTVWILFCWTIPNLKTKLLGW
jgi:hypothetical protein